MKNKPLPGCCEPGVSHSARLARSQRRRQPGATRALPGVEGGGWLSLPGRVVLVPALRQGPGEPTHGSHTALTCAS